MRSRYILLIFYFGLIGSGCKSQSIDNKEKSVDIKKSIELNNKAIQISILSCNKDTLLKAISIFREAIQLYPKSPLSYVNEAQIWCKLKEYGKAIEVLNYYLAKESGDPQLVLFKGFIFERIKEIDSANTCYKQVLISYEDSLAHMNSNIKILLDRAFIYFFIRDEKSALKEFDRIENRYPASKRVVIAKSTFETFKREEWISNMFSECDSGN